MDIKYLAVHHTAVSHKLAPAQFDAVNRYHRQKWGKKSSLGYYVGYHYYLGKGGELTQTRKHHEESVAIIGHNCDTPSRCDTISVCLAGDFNQEYPTEQQVNRLQGLYLILQKHYPGLKVVGHRDLQEERTCPGALINKDFFRMIEGDYTNESETEKSVGIVEASWERPFYQKLLSSRG